MTLATTSPAIGFGRAAASSRRCVVRGASSQRVVTANQRTSSVVTNAFAGAAFLEGLAGAVRIGEARRHPRRRVIPTRAAAAAAAASDGPSVGRPSYLDHPDPASFVKPASVLNEGDAVAGGVAGGVRRKLGRMAAAAVMTGAALAAPLAANAARVPAPVQAATVTTEHW